MKSSFFSFTALVTILAFMACKNAGSGKAEDSSTVEKPKVDTTSVGKTRDSEASSTLQLLQGKWQSMDDKSDFLVFDSNHRKEKAGGTGEWDDEVFILSDHCQNESDSDSTRPGEKDKYISCKKSDLCWYITSLDYNRLTLSYMGRGNELRYKRVKK